MIGLHSQSSYRLCAFIVGLLLLAGCVVPPGLATMDQEPAAADMVDDPVQDEHAPTDSLPALTPVDLAEGSRLQVVASTNIIADVVAKVGGDRIDIFSLIPIGADPHSFEPTPRDLVLLNEAHVIFVTGLGLEEQVEPIIDSLDSEGVMVSVNTGVDTSKLGDEIHEDDDEHSDEIHEDDDEHSDEVHEDDDEHSDEIHEDDDEHSDEIHEDDEHSDEIHEDGDEHSDEIHEEEHEGDHEDMEGDEDHHHHEGADPHTWFSIHAVEQWVENIEHVLRALDPANAAVYTANAQAYLVELEALAEEVEALLAALPAEKRKLVTDHDSFGYFAAAYDFDVVGTIIPSFSTLASPSAGELAKLQDQIEEEGVQAIFVGTTITPDIAQQLAADTGIQVVILYTGSLSDEGGPAASYVDFMRYNVTAIVNALKE